MGIIQQASGTSTGSGNFTVALPGASSASNLVVVSIVADSVIATPSGWTLRATQLNNVGHYMWDRAGGSTSYTFNLATAGQIAWSIAEIQGGVFDKAVSANNTANATSYPAPAITPAAGQKILLISFGAQKYFGNVPSAFTYSGSPTTDSFQTFAVTDNTTQGAAHLDIPSATGSTAYNFTATNGAPATQIASWSAIVGSYTTTSGGGSGSVTAVVATVTALSPIPTITGASNVSGGGVATATMQAIAPVVTGVSAGSVTAVRATVAALAPAPVVTGLTAGAVLGTVATASALALPPVIAGSVSASVSAVVATASTLALPPIVSAGGVANVSAVTATVSTLAPVPVVTGLRVASVVAVRGIVTTLALPPTISASSSVNVTAVPALATVQAIAPTVSASSGSLVLAVVALATMRAYAPSVSPSPSPTFEFDYRTSSWVGDAGTNQTWKPLEGPDGWV